MYDDDNLFLNKKNKIALVSNKKKSIECYI